MVVQGPQILSEGERPIREITIEAIIDHDLATA